MSSGVTVLTIKDDGQDFIVKRINCAAEKILQKNQTEVVGKRLFELYPMIDSFGLTEILRQVWLTGQPEIYPICLYEHSRLSKCLRNYVCKLQSGEIINMCDDLTQEKQFEEDMQINKERLESALQASGAGICECNLNTNEIYLSPQALRIFGLDESYSTINFNLFQTLILPDFRPDLQKHLEKIKNSQIEKFSFQYQIQTADGQKNGLRTMLKWNPETSRGIRLDWWEQ
jgi:PAS domain S-box-containing protein